MSHTSIVISVSTLGPGPKLLINHGDFQAEGESIVLLYGVSTNLQTKYRKYEQVRWEVSWTLHLRRWNDRSYMLLFSVVKPLQELSTFFAEGLMDCRDVVINKLVLSFEHIRGEQRTEKLREDCFASALALSPTVLSFLIRKRSGEKNSRSFTSCSIRTPEDW